jgi:cysteine dioxygenase
MESINDVALEQPHADPALRNLYDGIRAIGECYRVERRRTAELIRALDVDVAALGDLLQPPQGLPYGRKLLHHDGEMEVILMNWQQRCSCLPHDHGTSEGWLKVLAGKASHVYYAKGTGVPTAVKEETLETGTVLHAARTMVHHMANPDDRPLVTLHFYFPPITNMEVFDVDAARAAIVSSDCGAWWPPTSSQLVASRGLG